MVKDNGKTLIQVSNETWKQLNDYKKKPNESFEDVIKKFIEKDKEAGETASKEKTK